MSTYAPDEASVFMAVKTVSGEVVLRMTQEQAEQLREGINWLMGDDDD